MKRIISVLTITLLLSACATPTVVETSKINDNQLTCNQIKDELQQAEQFERAARKDRTVTGTNVAAAIFFWPALLGTYANTEEAINAAKQRKENLLKISAAKNCRI